MIPHNRDADPEVRAAQWILRRDRGEFAPQERADFEAWLRADSRHREAYLRLDEAWQLSAGLKAWRPINGEINAAVLGAQPARAGGSRRRVRALALAASLVLVCIAGLVSWSKYAREPAYMTRVGGYQRVLLDDGSVLQLNTDTQLQVYFTSARREIQLQRGEAFFEVAHDPNRPFEVIAGNATVRAVGTQFDVHRTDTGAEVTVAQGKVRLTTDTVVAPTPLAAGESAEARPSGIHIARVDQGELTRRLAWQVGELHFKNQPLAEVAAEFNRYNRRRLEITSPDLAAVPVGGNFKVNDLAGFVAAMRGSLPIHVEETDATVLISNTTP